MYKEIIIAAYYLQHMNEFHLFSQSTAVIKDLRFCLCA